MIEDGFLVLSEILFYKMDTQGVEIKVGNSNVVWRQILLHQVHASFV